MVAAIKFTMLTTITAKMPATRTELKTVKSPIITIALKGKSKVIRDNIKTKRGRIEVCVKDP